MPGMLSFSTVAWHTGHEAADASHLKLSPELCVQIESDLRKGIKPYRILDIINAAQDREDKAVGRSDATSYNNSRLRPTLSQIENVRRKWQHNYRPDA